MRVDKMFSGQNGAILLNEFDLIPQAMIVHGSTRNKRYVPDEGGQNGCQPERGHFTKISTGVIC